MTDVTDFNEFNRGLIDEFRATGGHPRGHFEGRPLLLLHTRGRGTGHERVNPLVYRRERGRIVVFASKAGAPSNPDWYLNLLAEPNAEIEIGRERLAVTASVVAGPEADEIWGRHKAEFPNFAEYESRTTRKIPVVVLAPASRGRPAD